MKVNKRSRSIPVQLTQPRRKSQEQLDAFEFCDPLRKYRRSFVGWRREGGKWAGGTELRRGHAAISRQRAIAQQMNEFIFFAQPENSWNAVAAGDPTFIREIAVFISVEENQVDHRRRGRDSRKHRTLSGTIAAPDAAEADHGHRADEACEQFALGTIERDSLELRMPIRRAFGIRCDIRIESKSLGMLCL